jgi:hypothetical protein
LGGNAREIIQLSWLVDSQNTDLVVGIETKIYVNDGPGGVPSTLLWESGPLTRINVSANDTFLNIAVPNITVPDTITVTSRILDSTPVALGRVKGGLPSVGSFNTSWIETSLGLWTEDFGSWGVRVSAVGVPEPTSVLGLLALGTLGAASILQRKLKQSKSVEKELEKVS